MPAPRTFLVAPTSLPLALSWGWNLSLYVGMLLGLLMLMLLLLWMLLKQLRNSVGKSTLQPARSFRQPHFEHRLQHVLTAGETQHRLRTRKCITPVTLQPPQKIKSSYLSLRGGKKKHLLVFSHLQKKDGTGTHFTSHLTGLHRDLDCFPNFFQHFLAKKEKTVLKMCLSFIRVAVFPQAYRGSVRPFVNFNAKHDAEILHRAMKGIGTDEDAILMLLTARSNDQRQQIKAAYKKAYGKDLISALKSELGGQFENLIVALMTPSVLYDASQLHKALKGAGTDDDVLIEILASRTGEQIKDIVKAYKKEFGGKLEKDICGDTSGNYQKLLVILLQGSREEGVDEGQIEEDAKELYAAGEGKFGTDEEKFITVLGNRSAEHLREGLSDYFTVVVLLSAVFDVYKKLSGSDIEDSIEGETTGNLENLLLAVVKCARSVPDFLAEGLYKSMRRAGTDDDTLMRIMVSRSEVDMLDIRASFKKMYRVSLYATIQVATAHCVSVYFPVAFMTSAK
ncbi:hypothetical protein L3Q82_020301 [Scortum barcoo]|uniref:Uncharacterized protein n=1 Tax=Scortum barcoo TaxID=214431 RepID=A0ACB8V724_9TELE|nr:hypothetical protein L3Q82_020301 [Scortum barcoo]